jgi:K+-sensing histidine kinase KdpD
MVKRKASAVEKYAVAVGVVCVAFALRYSLHDTLGNRIPFAFFTLATIVAAWYGGLGPGLLAAAGGLLLADVFFLPPHLPEGLGETERTSIGIYAMTNTLIVVLFWNLHTRLREAQDEIHRRAGAPGAGERPDSSTGAPGQMRPL